jgi:hypothetical protein
MPKKRTTPKRPRDLNQLAVQVGKIATHQIEDELPAPVDGAATKRGEARAKALTPAERKTIASNAAKAMWAKRKGR